MSFIKVIYSLARERLSLCQWATNENLYRRFAYLIKINMTDKINYTHRHRRLLTRLHLHVHVHAHRSDNCIRTFRPAPLISPRIVYAFRFVWLPKSFLQANLRPCLAGKLCVNCSARTPLHLPPTNAICSAALSQTPCPQKGRSQKAYPVQHA